MLDLADIRQTKVYDCGHAAIKIVLDYWGVNTPVGLTKWLKMTPDVGAVEPRMVSCLEASGLEVLNGAFALTHLRWFSREGTPVVCLVQRHWVVVRGVARKYVHYIDPQYGADKLDFDSWEHLHGQHNNFGVAAYLKGRGDD